MNNNGRTISLINLFVSSLPGFRNLSHVPWRLQSAERQEKKTFAGNEGVLLYKIGN